MTLLLENGIMYHGLCVNTTFHHNTFFILCGDTDCPFLIALYQPCNAHSDIFQWGCRNNEGLGPKAGESRS